MKQSTQQAIQDRLKKVASHRNEDPIRIDDQEDLAFFANEVGTRVDWHEPDEQDLTAHVYGRSFDNAGFWGEMESRYNSYDELHVVFCVNDFPVAAVNLATLCAWATRDYRDWELPGGEPTASEWKQRALKAEAEVSRLRDRLSNFLGELRGITGV